MTRDQFARVNYTIIGTVLIWFMFMQIIWSTWAELTITILASLVVAVQVSIVYFSTTATPQYPSAVRARISDRLRKG